MSYHTNGTVKPRVLIIDDEDQVRRLLLELLASCYTCHDVSSTEDALNALGKESFDLVISDINMGDMSGLDLVPHVRSISPDTVVVMISGQHGIETAIQAMRVGAFDYITKPLDVRHVEAAVERALQHHQLLVEKRRYEEQLESLLRQRTAEVNRLAYYDTLTDLPNRVLFEDRLRQAMAVARRGGQTLGILFVVVDQVKKVNDSLGHEPGDMLLKEMGSRLRGCVSESATVARFGGDEFAVLLPSVRDAAEVGEVIGAISEVLKPSFSLNGHELYATASIGISLYPVDAEDTPSLLQNAGAALYRARKLGGNTYQFFTADMHSLAAKRLALETSLRQAIENEEFTVHYQPRAKSESLRITGVEALVRWQHPQLGLVSPAEFIPLAEDTGLIVPIGEWVLREACRQNKQWQDEGWPPMHVAVNLSARQFQHQDILGMVVRILEETGLPPQYLELELTESSVMGNAEFAIDVLNGLKAMGVRITIDDFGTGFSSLSYLKRLPIDTLKVDRSFVREAPSDPDDAAMVMAIITLAHNLRLNVVAEGVETQEQLQLLRLLRCDEIQGFFFSRPLAVDAVSTLLATHCGRDLPVSLV
ncbi:MAG TPA: EAL domain-containing protein [Pyrinomonadaceae bacterium]|nr:EAL domain-containing protein [Pyrinomonadaceae bacterium]